MERQCAQCGQKFWATASQISWRIFCSQRCARKSGEEAPRELYGAGGTRSCEWCGAGFIPAPNNLEQIYCSKECARRGFRLSVRKKQQTERPRETKIERVMRYELARRNLPFEAQAEIGTWTVDFLVGSKVVVECDGAYWHNKPDAQERDLKRDAELQTMGYQVLRFGEVDILERVGYCVDAVQSAAGGAAEVDATNAPRQLAALQAHQLELFQRLERIASAQNSPMSVLLPHAPQAVDALDRLVEALMDIAALTEEAYPSDGWKQLTQWADAAYNVALQYYEAVTQQHG